MVKRNQRKTGGWLTIELIVAVALTALLIGILATLGSAFKKVNDQRWLRQTLTAAGQAQMDAIAVTGKPIDEQKFNELWPGVTCDVKIDTGDGQWAGLQEIRLTLWAEKRGKTVESAMVRYVPMREGRSK